MAVPLALFLLLAVLSCAPAPERPPNLVLLIGDDHGYPDFGFMGSDIVETPNLDELAAEGVVFTTGYSTSSLCRPALRTLVTGLDPLQYDRLELRAEEIVGKPLTRAQVMRSVEGTLPRLLAERGYRSFQAGKYLEGHFAGAGFDAGMVEHPGVRGNEAAAALVRETLEPVLEFVTENRDRPFFLWFAPRLPHLPHDPPARLLERYDDTGLTNAEKAYYASIDWFDEGVGHLLQHLEASGVREHTLLVYVVDNGWDPQAASLADDWVLGGDRGKKSLYELGFRTPVVLNWPGSLEPARYEEPLVSLLDVFPTLLDYAEVEVPPGRIGRSLRPFVEGREPWKREALIGHMHVLRDRPEQPVSRGFFWRDARWHLLAPEGLPAELYDLEHDPLEQHNVATQHPERVARAIRAIRSWSQDLPRVPPRPL